MVKRSDADVFFSKCVREAANHTCERCGKVCGTTENPIEFGRLDCSHIFSRRHRTIRWCKENAVAHCFTCHNWFGGNPIDAGQWAEQHLGDGAVQLLREKRDSRQKVSKAEEKEIAKHYKEQHKQMLEARASGEVFVDFDSYQ